MENKKIIIIMSCVILLLLMVVAYSFVVSPTIDSYIIKKQTETQNLIFEQIKYRIQQEGYIQIPVGEDVLTLVQYVQE